MSTPPVPPTPPAPAVPSPGAEAPPAMPRELRIYGHSTIFYWWPVWAFGYLMAVLTAWDGSVMAVVPNGSAYPKNSKVIELSKPLDDQQQRLTRDNGTFYVHMSASKNLGVFYTIVLIVVIFITNFPLRGLASALAVALIVVVSLAFALMGWWEDILGAFFNLAIFNNQGFYVFLSTVLLVIWLAVVFVFDRFNYWRITPGQITHEYVFGGGQVSFDTEGIALKKYRDDLFRHWVLGLGSGDIIMHPMQSGGVPREEMAIHNVLFVGHKLAQMQQLVSLQADTRE
jgi:uncharacterized membrane protein YkgB